MKLQLAPADALLWWGAATCDRNGWSGRREMRGEFDCLPRVSSGRIEVIVPTKADAGPDEK